jgi:hypothetical protein
MLLDERLELAPRHFAQGIRRNAARHRLDWLIERKDLRMIGNQALLI